MDAKWDSYTHFPASGEEFERYVGTVFDDLGYKVYLTPKRNDYGVDLVLEEPKTEMRIAVQTKFYSKSSLGNTPIQEVLAGLSLYKAQVGWVVTNGRFSDNAINLAKANGVRLIDNDGLNELIDQAKTARKKAEFEQNISVETNSDESAVSGGKDSSSDAAAYKVKDAISSDAASDHTPKTDPLTLTASMPEKDEPAGVNAVADAAIRPGESVPSSSVSSNPVSGNLVSGSPVSASSPSFTASAQSLSHHVSAIDRPTRPAAIPSGISPVSVPSPSEPVEAVDPIEPVGHFQYMTVFGVPEIQMRWGCSADDVMDQISQGMPMVQLPSGTWGITQGDLFAWEAHMEDARQENLRHQQIFSLIFIGSAVIIFAICILLLIYNGSFD